MPDLKSLLEQDRVLVTDGAWGTELGRHGLPAGTAPEEWNLSRPQAVADVALSYVEAGSDIILTNTFGGSPFSLQRDGLGERVAEVNRIGAELSKSAAADRALVFGSIGPTGQFLEPLGSISYEAMVDCFTRQAQGLLQGGVDGIVIETMTDLGEMRAALEAVKSLADLPIAASMSFDKEPNGFATMMGVTPARAAEELQAAGADIVGTNCGCGIENAIEVVRQMHGATDRPIWAKPNAGLPILASGRTVFRQPAEEMVTYVPALIEAGARFIGGCCGTTPTHIRLFSQAVREQKG
jgi:5-methyltetrahydrofolate--homocysteine methyltransferase